MAVRIKVWVIRDSDPRIPGAWDRHRIRDKDQANVRITAKRMAAAEVEILRIAVTRAIDQINSVNLST
jgi:hypothetical protein